MQRRKLIKSLANINTKPIPKKCLYDKYQQFVQASKFMLTELPQHGTPSRSVQVSQRNNHAGAMQSNKTSKKSSLHQCQQYPFNQVSAQLYGKVQKKVIPSKSLKTLVLKQKDTSDHNKSGMKKRDHFGMFKDRVKQQTLILTFNLTHLSPQKMNVLSSRVHEDKFDLSEIAGTSTLVSKDTPQKNKFIPLLSPPQHLQNQYYIPLCLLRRNKRPSMDPSLNQNQLSTRNRARVREILRPHNIHTKVKKIR